MTAFARWRHSESPTVVGLVLGACLTGSLGAIAGLVVGLWAYPPTAWAAVFEIGIPASLVGAPLGAVAGWLLGTARGSARDQPAG